MFQTCTSLIFRHVWQIPNLHLPSYSLPILSSPVFDLGEGVAAFGILFAVVAIAKPSWATVMAIKGEVKSRAAWGVALSGLVILVFSMLLPIPTDKTSAMLNPLLWQIFAAALFVSAPFVMMRVGTNITNLFNKYTAERFYHVLLQNISTGDSKKVALAVDIIGANLKTLLQATKEADLNFKRRNAKTNDYKGYAYSLIGTALSDTKVAVYIATKRIDFIWNYVQLIKEKRLGRDEVGDSFSAIVRQLYQNPNSYLYRQEQYRGTGRYASVNDVIFASTHIQLSFSPVSLWTYYNTPRSTQLSEDFVGVLLRTLETTIKNGAFDRSAQGYQQPGYVLYELNRYAGQIIREDPSPESYNEVKKILSKIEDFYGTTFLELYSEALKANKVSAFEKSAAKARRYTNQSLTSIYADALAEYLGILTYYDEKSVMTRHMAMSATDKLITFSDPDPAYDNIRKAFLEYVWDQIKENVERGFYPATIRVYIQLVSFILPSAARWYKDEHEKLITYMNEVLKPKIRAGTLMNNQRVFMEDALLPNSVIYDRENDKFLHVDDAGNRSALK